MRISLTTLLILTVLALPVYAARKEAEIVIFTLDTQTEIPFDDRDRTDRHFFHGMVICNIEHTSDSRLEQMLDELADSATESSHPPAVRAGEFGVRQSQNGRPARDLLICLNECRSPRIIVLGKPDREARLKPDQERLLRGAIARVIKTKRLVCTSGVLQRRSTVRRRCSESQRSVITETVSDGCGELKLNSMGVQQRGR